VRTPTEGLTSLDPAFDKKVRDTIAGMAHWTRTGPDNTFCGDCRFLVTRGSLGYGCDKFRQLTGTVVQQPIPRQMRSCKYFEQREVSYGKRSARHAATDGGTIGAEQSAEAEAG
jgi:hypothetical protein